MQNIVEKARRRPLFSTAVAVILASTAYLEIDGYSSNPTYDVPSHSCASPFAISKKFGDPATNTLFMTDTGINTTGVIASGQLPRGASGVQAAYENPKEHGTDWHISDMVKAKHAGVLSLKLAIGAGDVHFGIRTIAPEGAANCSKSPPIKFENVSASRYFENSGQLPWPNPLNIIANELSGLG